MDEVKIPTAFLKSLFKNSENRFILFPFEYIQGELIDMNNEMSWDSENVINILFYKESNSCTSRFTEYSKYKFRK